MSQSNRAAALTERERFDRLRLARTETIGPITFRQLLARYDSASAALEALPDLAAKSGRKRRIRVCPANTAEQEQEALTALGGRHLVFGDPAYPAPLAAIDDAPMVLSLIGATTLLNRDGIAVVGARNASTNSRNFARRLADDLGAAGLAVISGLARGIDAAAHTGALGHATVAVLGGGVDVKYPRENAALHDEIAEKGLLVSEIPCGIQPQARHFPRRNRIISGLSLGVVVVEAALRSGSLITARLAGEQGRDVFAVPGSPLDPRCKGTNDLIRKGALLTETAEDVLTELAPIRGPQRTPPATQPAPADTTVASVPDRTAPAAARDKINEMIGPTPLSIDDIVRDSGLSINTVWNVLLELELAGHIERQPGNLIARLAG